MSFVFRILPTDLKLLFGVFFLFILAAGSFGQTPVAGQPAELKLGVPVEGDFRSGTVQTFALHLDGNQFASLVLTQKGVNLAIAVDDAKDEKRLLEIDVNYGNFGYDRALIESENEPRDLLIRVFPPQKDQAAAAKFSLVLAESAAADARNQQRIAAQTAILDSLKLLLEAKSESRFKGFLLMGNALKTARESGDQTLVATSLLLLEKAYFVLGNHQKVIEYGEEALPLLTSPENVYFQLIVKDTIGPSLVAMGEFKRAVEILNEVLVKSQEIGDSRLVMSSYINLGFANLRLVNPTKALEYAEKSLPIAKELNIKTSQIESLRIMGLAHNNLNDYNKAIESLNRALAIAEEAKLEDFIFPTQFNLGENYKALGQLQKAIDYYQPALDRNLRVGGSKTTTTLLLSSIADCYASMGQSSRALEYRQQALQVLKELGYKDAIMQSLIAQGRIYLSLKDYEKAKDLFTQALAMAKTSESLLAVSTVYSALGLTEKRRGNFAAALEYDLKAEEIRKQSNAKLTEATSLNNISDSYLTVGQSARAAEYAAKALAISQASGDLLNSSGALYNLARARRHQKELASALKAIEDSLKIVEDIRSTLVSRESRTAFLSTVRDKYDFYISLLIELQDLPANKNYGALAFAASERARARGLLDLLAESNTDVSAGISPELKERERGIEAKISALQTKLIRLQSAAAPDQKLIGEVQESIKKTDEEREKLESEIRRNNPRYAELKYPTTVDLAQTQESLDEKTVLLEYQTSTRGSFLFAVGKNEFQIIKLPGEKTLRASVETLHRSLSTPARTNLANYLVTGSELYKVLVAPVENLLKTKTKIIIAADGSLNYLPFETLLRNNQSGGLDKLPYLVRDFEISYTPSASVSANLKNYDDKAAKPAKSFLAFAAPDYGTKPENQDSIAVRNTRSVFGENRTWSLADLQFAKTEAMRIAKLFPADQATVFTGAEATEERVKSSDLLNQYRYLHFAVHGLIDEEQPQFSSLILSLPKTDKQSAATEDGLLQTPEIFNLRLRADLVTLSACETGLGQEMRGEGIVGLTRAFFYAGTPSVLVSLWKVDDASTAELMAHFYENLQKGKGRDKAAALRETQLKLIAGNNYAHPYYWASFILQGKTSSSFKD